MIFIVQWLIGREERVGLMGKGVGSWMQICPYCGRRYRLTNFMKRGHRDTHTIGCRKRTEDERDKWWGEKAGRGGMM